MHIEHSMKFNQVNSPYFCDYYYFIIHWHSVVQPEVMQNLFHTESSSGKHFINFGFCIQDHVLDLPFCSEWLTWKCHSVITNN